MTIKQKIERLEELFEQRKMIDDRIEDLLKQPDETDEAIETVIKGEIAPPPRTRGECSCGHVGRGRHKSDCSIYSGKPAPRKAQADMSDLRDLHAWECIDCGKIVETRETELDVPCSKCNGTLVQKF